MLNRVCSKCKEKKILIDFTKDKNQKTGYRTVCKQCTKEYYKLYRKNNKIKISEFAKKYRDNNTEKIDNYHKKYRENNQQKIKQRYKKHRLDNLEKIKQRDKGYYNQNKDKIKKYKKNYYLENKVKIKNYLYINKNKINKRKRKRYHEDELYKVSCILRSTINSRIKTKYKSTCEILGCSFVEFRDHIESQFKPWMTWKNHGNPEGDVIELNKTWDLDHIIPMSYGETVEELIKLNHYTNFQPLCSYINRYIKRGNVNKL
jgi:hypothetical protein